MTATKTALAGGQLYENLRKVVTVVDELRDVGLQQYVTLPRIAVVGTQSGGKSSVLESIVGADFLPRGDGVVTRRPLELRLVHLPQADSGTWAVFAAKPDEKLSSFEEVRLEIIRQTETVCGKNKGIVDDPIVLSVYSPTCPDLTLIDLPGITRVPVRNSDQRDDIEGITKAMAMRYISDPRTIILAVVPANQDMSTSDALQMARQVDPNGLRTIGVVTKLDIMDPGTDAMRMLLGEEVSLRLGFVGVRNRGQQDIRNEVRVNEALDTERRWFSEHPKYSKLPPGYCGTDNLVDKLTKVLFKHIKQFLPQIKKEVSEKKRKVSERLAELGEGVPDNSAEQGQLIWTMITDYCDIFKNTIRGKFDRRLQTYLTSGGSQMSGGAQIRQIFNNFLQDFEDKRVTEKMSDDEIDLAIRMHEGDSLPGFPSPDIFEFLILPHLRRIGEPSTDCVASVAGTLELLSQKIGRNVFKRFPKLGEQVLELSAGIIGREREKTKGVIEQIVDLETGYLFTNDPGYLGEHGSLQKIFNPQAPVAQASVAPGAPPSAVTLGPAEAKRKGGYAGAYVSEIRSRLDSYFSLVVRSVRDSVPKAVGFFLVRKIQDQLQFELYNSLNKPDAMGELLGEPDVIRTERKQLQRQLSVLENANAVLSRDPAIAAIQMDGVADEEPAFAPQPRVQQPQQSTAALFASAPKVRTPATSLFDEAAVPRRPANPLFD